MKENLPSVFLALLISMFLLLKITGCGTDALEPDPDPPEYTEAPWISAYLAAWNHRVPSANDGNLTSGDIDWDAFTHLIYFSLRPLPEGVVIPIEEGNLVHPERVEDIVSAAHQAGRPVLISIGGEGHYEAFSNAIRPENRPGFIASMLDAMTTWGFDGIDLDMEPIENADVPHYKNLVRELAAEFDQIETPMLDRPLLTAATDWQPGMFADLQEYFDQINLMTYDFSGAWDGWVSWHNSPIYDGGHSLPGGRTLPSVDWQMNEFLQAGIARRKLGTGISFHGYVWHGQVDGPLQEWSESPEVDENVPFYEIMEIYYPEGEYNWDDEVGAAWISISHEDPDERKFISYTEKRAVGEKLEHSRSQGLGGVIIWDLGGGYQANMSDGERDVLLQTIKQAIQMP
jgi:chitinase